MSPGQARSGQVRSYLVCCPHSEGKTLGTSCRARNERRSRDLKPAPVKSLTDSWFSPWETRWFSSCDNFSPELFSCCWCLGTRLSYNSSDPLGDRSRSTKLVVYSNPREDIFIQLKQVCSFFYFQNRQNNVVATSE